MRYRAVRSAVWPDRHSAGTAAATIGFPVSPPPGLVPPPPHDAPGASVRASLSVCLIVSALPCGSGPQAASWGMLRDATALNERPAGSGSRRRCSSPLYRHFTKMANHPTI
jgi:hypothetical protein